ncbi:unnamed protein product [Prunus brigantina]
MVAHDLNSGQNLNPVMDTMGIASVQYVIDGASFRDKLMNKVNLVKNIGIEVNSLDTNYDELNDDEDVRLGFFPATAQITRMAGWIRVSAIRLECFDPLEAFVQINQEWYNIEYEGLLDICYLCGRYGHKREHCEKRNSIPAPVPGEGQSSVAEDVLGGERRSKQCIRIREVEVMGLELKAQDLMLCMVEPSIGDEDLGKKVWTKSKVVKPDVRATLNDISNMPQQDKKHVTTTARKEGGSKSTGFGL